MSETIHDVTRGDTLTPMSVELLRRVRGRWVPVDLRNKTVKFRMVDQAGAVKVDDSAVGVTVVNAVQGLVAYDFHPADVDTAGVYYAWFLVADESGEQDTYPRRGRRLRVDVTAAS